ncbi:MAG: TMEM165/GDT1 family protein [Methylomonas lenta]|nr:TMEM165/GDT1 family protein [Methylomonas lenta]
MNTLLNFIDYLNNLSLSQVATTSVTSFVLIAAAEIGDKSQLVCMTLASRHRAAPVLWGAITAFAVLNTLAVVFGAAIADWLPDYLVAASVAMLFASFGLHALLNHTEEDDDGEVVEKSGHNIFFTTFLLIIVAEFGDKTQLAVVAFSSTAEPLAVWLGATLALSFTSGLGVWAGRTVLQRIPLQLLHKISGLLFLALAAVAAYQAYTYAQATAWWPQF